MKLPCVAAAFTVLLLLMAGQVSAIADSAQNACMGKNEESHNVGSDCQWIKENQSKPVTLTEYSGKCHLAGTSKRNIEARHGHGHAGDGGGGGHGGDDGGADDKPALICVAESSEIVENKNGKKKGRRWASRR